MTSNTCVCGHDQNRHYADGPCRCAYSANAGGWGFVCDCSSFHSPHDDPDAKRVCPEHLRFLPCRRCKSLDEAKASSDPFIVEIARRYQASELQFTLACDAPGALTRHSPATEPADERYERQVRHSQGLEHTLRKRNERIKELEAQVATQANDPSQHRIEALERRVANLERLSATDLHEREK